MKSDRLQFIICLFLIVSTLAVYWQVSDHDFISFDDPDYVTENSNVLSGLTKKGFTWAFTTFHAGNWHPLTWLSHMLDCELFSLDAGKHHLMNLLFHIANALLLFLVLKKMTAAPWRSGFVAALFALHPLHVESVAWVSERKDVLSTFFWMLTMWAYVRYTVRPKFRRYILVLVFFVLGLISKPMLVTLPFILLLMDYWPLDRLKLDCSGGKRGMELQKSSALRLIWEKVPLFAIAGSISVVTIIATQKVDALPSLNDLPLQARAANALVSYVSYIGKMIWPDDLAVFYPHQGIVPIWYAGGAGLFLVCSSIMFMVILKNRPYLAIGWLWYLGSLLPMIGLVQGGAQSMADRYTYIPLIGLFIMIAWGIPDLMGKWEHKKVFLPALAGILISILIASTWTQLRHWQDSLALFGHSLEVTDGNWLAHHSLGVALIRKKNFNGGIKHYHKAIQINPNYWYPHYNLGLVKERQGKSEEAMRHYSEAIRINPENISTLNNLASILLNRGRLEEAIDLYKKALDIDPGDVKARSNLGTALARKGDFEGAIRHYSEALRINPTFKGTHINLGIVLVERGNLDDAAFHFREALRIDPRDAKARTNLDRLLKRKGGPARTSDIKSH